VSAQLDFDEFVEIVVRICNEKVSEARKSAYHDVSALTQSHEKAAAPRDGPFEQALDNYLGLLFVPAAQKAARARINKMGGATDAASKRILASST
jgi:hypothetical protein